MVIGLCVLGLAGWTEPVDTQEGGDGRAGLAGRGGGVGREGGSERETWRDLREMPPDKRASHRVAETPSELEAVSGPS